MKCSTISCINSQVLRKSYYYLFYRRYHVNFIILPGFHQVRDFQRLLRDEEISLWSCQSSWGLFEVISWRKDFTGIAQVSKKRKKRKNPSENRVETREYEANGSWNLSTPSVTFSWPLSRWSKIVNMYLPSPVPPSDRLNTFSSTLVNWYTENGRKEIAGVRKHECFPRLTTTTTPSTAQAFHHLSC